MSTRLGWVIFAGAFVGGFVSGGMFDLLRSGVCP